ncbi:WAT1-related protein At2g39510-like [Rosa rugosa]|uniref:WAT1-related protein At2g39510-like n=1 Tax=Rosa rugosa TaxID=74645 RepID=UPI002B41024C|nr:WAT1-related protein At2g39510-like [Rosa rugosa]
MSCMTAILVIAICFVQALYAGLSIITILALGQCKSHYTSVVYRMAITTALASPLAWYLERNSRPTMTIKVMAKIMLLSMFECSNPLFLILGSPVMNLNLYYAGMDNSNATFTSAMCNMLPVLAFVMAWIFRLENVDYRHPRGLAKVLGTLVTLVGAILFTMVKGPSLTLPWARDHEKNHSSQPKVKGALFLTLACFCCSCFMILQDNVLKSYPCKLSLTALICFWGMVEGAVVAVVVERGDSEAWSIHLDFKLLAAVYGALLSGATYYVMGLVVKKKGPVFYWAFNPLATLLVAILGPFFLAQQLHTGSLIGAVTIVGGLYLVLWGKSRDQPSSDSKNANVKEPTGTRQV